MLKSIGFIVIICCVFHLELISQCPDLSPGSSQVVCLNSPPFTLDIQYPSLADSVVIQFESDSVRANFVFNPYGLPTGVHYLPFTYEIYYNNQPDCFGLDSIAIEVVGTVYSIDIIGDTIICLGDEARLFSVEIRDGEEVSWAVNWNGSSVSEPFTIVAPSITTNYYYDYEVGSLTTTSYSCAVRDYFDVEVFTFGNTLRAVGSSVSCEFATASFSVNSLVDSVQFTALWPNGSNAPTCDTVVTAFTSFNLLITNDNYGCDTTYVFDVPMTDQTEIILDSVFEICTGQLLDIFPEGGYYYSINNDSVYLGGAPITLSVDSDSTFFIRSLREDQFLDCTESMTFDVRVFPYPEITIMDQDSMPFVSDSICRGTLVAASVMGAEMYDWYTSNDDFSFGSDTGYVLQPDFSTDYFVIGWQYICSDTDSFHIGVKQLPFQEIFYDGPFCEDSSITVWYEESDNILLWQNQSPTNYQDWILSSDTVITLTSLDSFGCVARDTLAVTMNQNPDIVIVSPDSVCSGELFPLSVSGALYYQWNFGSTDSLVSTSIQADQFFTVLGTTSAGCADRDTIVVRARNLPYLFVSPNAEICFGDSVFLSVYSDYDYTPAIENGQTVILPQADTSITFSATNEFGCTSSRTFEITVRPLPSIIITGTPNACPDEILSFEAQGAETYFWNIANDGNSASLVVTQDSVINVNGFSIYGCRGFTSFDIYARDLPTIEISGDDIICPGGTTVLSGASDFAFVWEGIIADSQIVLNDIYSDTLINIFVTNQFGCSAEFEKWVTVADLNADVVITGDDSLCSGENTILTAAGDAVFFWFDSLSTSQLNLIGLANDSVVYLTAINQLGCDTTISKTIHVFPYPSLQFDDNLFSCEGQWLTVNANTNVPVLWSDG
ncbi:MAG: hypothetical protein ACKOW8_10715, partial [Flavobacteriales bacterium]